jgi:hypothetical protein
MRRVTKTEFSLVALGALALVQLMAMVLQATPAADSPAFGLQVGETAAGIQAKDSTGARISLANAQLTARTPWVFFLDREGVVLAQGHGAKINEIAADVLNHLDREE